MGHSNRIKLDKISSWINKTRFKTVLKFLSNIQNAQCLTNTIEVPTESLIKVYLLYIINFLTVHIYRLTSMSVTSPV